MTAEDPTARAVAPSGRRETLVAALLVVLAVVYFVLRARSFLPFVSDDTLIALRYADRLVDGRGLTWDDAQRVEGYSDLLWVLLCAALHAVGIPLVFAGRAVNAVSTAALAGALVRAAWPDRILGALAVVGLAACDSLAAWLVGGLEAPLFAALIAWACLVTHAATTRRGLALAGALFALAAITRPEGALFAIGALAFLRLHAIPSIDRRAALAALLAPVAVAVLGQLAFRLAYYGDVVPNSAHVKLAFSGRRVAQGLGYLGIGLREQAPLWLLGGLALAQLWRRRGTRPSAALVGLPVLAWCAYLVAIGGDILPASRHLIPLAALLLLGLVLAARALAAPRRTVLALGAALALLLGALQLTSTNIQQVRSEVWEWDGVAVGRVIAGAFTPARPMIAVDAAGAVPYFSHLPAIDMLGLNDRVIATSRVEGLGTGPIGHELGNGASVLERHPDIVLFCRPEGAPEPCFLSGRQMVADPRWAGAYRRVDVETPVLARPMSMYVALDSPVTGIRAHGDEAEVPGYLFAGRGGHVAVPDGEGRLVLRVAPASEAVLTGFALPDGDWSVAEGQEEDVRARLSASGAGAARRFELRVRARGGSRLGRVRLVRDP
ncbi:MAG: hypothetical protein U0234_05770 [Sandaracinus sp.]